MQEEHLASDDRAGREYWDDRWAEGDLPAAINPNDTSRRNYVNRRFHTWFRDLFRDAGKSHLFEVGCGSSVMLPYFAREFGLTVSGLDYSEEGCAKARAILAREDVAGNVHLADLFSPPEGLVGAFDFVVSFGVVEHFTDTDASVRAVAAFARPGGTVVTLIPNMRGVPGALQKALNRRVWDAHVPLGADRLREAHERAGLEVSQSGYFIGMNFGINNLFGLDPSRISTRFKGLVLKVFNLASLTTWELEALTTKALPTSAWLSPYVVTVARLPAGARDGR